MSLVVVIVLRCFVHKPQIAIGISTRKNLFMFLNFPIQIFRMVFVNCLDVTRVEIVPELEAAKIALNVLVSPLILGVLDHGVNIQH